MLLGNRAGLRPRTVDETYWYVVCSTRRYIIPDMHQVPGTRYVVYMLVPGVWLHPRPSSWGPRDTLSTPNYRSETKPTCWGAVCVGANWSLQLRLHQKKGTHLLVCLLCRCQLVSPTTTSPKKKAKQLRTALECIPSRAITIYKNPELFSLYPPFWGQ